MLRFSPFQRSCIARQQLGSMLTSCQLMSFKHNCKPEINLVRGSLCALIFNVLLWEQTVVCIFVQMQRTVISYVTSFQHPFPLETSNHGNRCQTRERKLFCPKHEVWTTFLYSAEQSGILTCADISALCTLQSCRHRRIAGLEVYASRV